MSRCAQPPDIRAWPGILPFACIERPVPKPRPPRVTTSTALNPQYSAQAEAQGLALSQASGSPRPQDGTHAEPQTDMQPRRATKEARSSQSTEVA